MKTRTSRSPRPATPRPGPFALHPLSLASLLALASPVAFGLPQGGVVVNGQVKIGKPTATQQIITQASQKAIVDWTSFSIAAGEKLRFDQPSSSAVILNRVTGYDPSRIFGQMEANGRVFLLNPYGVVFGASARVDVGGLVASSLSLSNADFTAGRLRLSSNEAGAPALRGEVRNEGFISAPGGTVVLAAPSVTNTGAIEARGGRVGMAAAQDVLVDVEGDGLILFQASATQAGNRLAQLGRIQADGGSVELRAAARGAFADTVLNMTGVVQARTLGTREGRVVIDGGDAGITRVAGWVETSGAGAGERGGRITVTGQKVLLDDAAVLNASGDAGGGTVLAGGNWQGRGPEANAQMTHVARGAQIDVSATGSGDGGTAVVWSDESTRFFGDIAARGGASGGDGGKIEVSGKKYLGFDGSVDMSAPAGHAGSLLLDPSDITISNGTDSGVDLTDASAPFDLPGSGSNSVLNVGTLTNLLRATAGGGDVTVNASAGSGGSGSISVEAAVTWNSTHSLTLLATGTISSNASGAITNNGTGGLTLRTDGAVTLSAPITLAGGSLVVAGTAGGATAAASFATSSTITTTGATGTLGSAGGAGGNVTIATSGNIGTGTITARGGTGSIAAGQGLVGGAGGQGGAVNLTTSNGTIQTAGVDASGGDGGQGGAVGGGPAGSGGVGGNAGTITIAAAGAGQGATVSGSLAAVGGTGGDEGVGGSGASDGGNGGGGNTVNVSSAGGSVSVVGITSFGGGGGGGGGATAGANANVALNAGTDLTLGGALNTGGGGTTTAGLSFGQANTGGVLDLTSAGLITANTVSATGGTGTDRVQTTLASGNLTLDAATLTITGQSPIAVTAVDDLRVTGSSGNNTITLTGWAGTATVQTTTGTDTVTGNGAGTTLAGPTSGAYALTGPRAGTVGGTTFSAVGTINGGSGDDTFTLGAGVTTFNGTINGGTGANTLAATDGTNAIAIAGANAGTLNATTVFTGITTVDGGSGADTFTLAAGVTSFGGTLAGGGGTNTLVLTDGTNAITLSGANAGTLNTTTTFNGIATLTGGTGTDTLTGPAAGTAFSITGANAVTVAGIDATSIDALVGGAGNDTFTLAAGVASFNGSISGGTGTDALVLTDGTNAITVSGTNAGALNTTTTFSAIDTLTGGTGTDTLTGPAGGGAFNITGANAVTVAGVSATSVEALAGGAGNDTFTLAAGVPTFNGPIDGGAGANTLAATNGTNTFTVDAANGGTLNTTTSFTNIGSLSGGSGNDTLVAANDLASITLTDATIARTGLTTINLSGFEAASLAGGAGANDIVASDFSGNVSVLATAGTDNVTGNGADTTLVGPTSGNYAITAARAGTVGGTTFSAVGTIDGGSGADTFTLAAGVTSFGGTLAGGGGTNTLVLTDGTNAITLSGANAGTLNTTTTFNGIATLTGGTGTDTLTGPAAGTAFSITGANAVTVAGIDATSIDALVGGAGNDTFTLAAGVASFNGSISGGTGTDALVLTDGTNAITVSGTNAGALNTTTSFSAIDTLTGGTGTDTLTGPAGGGAFNITGANAVTVAGVSATSVEALAGGAGNDTFTLAAGVPTFNGPIDGGAGANTLAATNGTNTFTVDAANGGTLNTTTSFTNIGSLSGGSGNDGFVFASTASGATLTGTVNGGGGTNTLDLSARTGPVVVNQQSSTATDNASALVGAFSNIGVLAGSTLTGTEIIGADAGQTFTLGTANLAGTAGTLAFTGVSRLTAGSGTDTLVAANDVAAITLTDAAIARTGFTTISLSGFEAASVSGGAGANAIAANGFAGTVGVLASAGADTVTGNGVNTTLVGTGAGSTFTVSAADSVTLVEGANVTTATGVGNLTGGAGNDTFAIADPGTLSGGIDGGGGTNTLDLSNKTSATIVFNQGSSTITGVGVAGAITNVATTIGNGINTTLQGSNAGQSFAITANNEITIGGTQVFRGVGNLNAGTGADSISGTTFGLVGNIVDAGGANTLSGTISTGGAQTYAGSVSSTLPLTLAAGGNISATNAANDFGTLSISTSGSAGAAIVDTNDLALGTVSLLGNGANSFTAGASVGSTLSRTATLVATNTPTLTVGGVAVDNGLRDLFTTGAASSVQIQAGTAGTHNLTATGVGLLPGLTVTGNLAVTAAAATNITQSGALTVAGTSAINAGAGSITLTSANDFQGAVSLSGGTTQITDANALTLGALATGALTATSSGALGLGQGSVAGNLAATSNGGSVAQAGGLTVAGTSAINAGAGSITLTSANDFQGAVSLSGGTTQITDANALTLGALATGALTATSSGALGLGQGSVAGNLAATSNGGSVAQAGGLTVAGTSAINAGAGSITLTSANDFQGAVSLSGGTTQITDANALTLGALATGALTATSSGALGLGQGSVAGNLAATSNGGNVAQAGGLTVAGTSAINAGAGSITLTSANDFQGAVSLSGGTTQITDANALTLGALATGALTATSSGALGLGQGSVAGNLAATSNGGSVAQAGGLTVAGTSAINAGAGSITLTSANDFQGAVSLSGGTTQITDANALTLGALATGALTATSSGALGLGQGSVAGNLAATSNGGSVAQAGGLTVAGTSAINAGAGSITLTSANDFQGAVSLSGGTTQITDANALTLASATVGAGQTFTATAAGTITLNSSIGTTADQTFAGDIALANDVTLAAGGGRVDLQGNVDGGGHNLTLSSTGVAANALHIGGAISNTAAFTADGRSTVGANVTTTGAQTYTGLVTLAADAALNAGSANIALQNVEGGTHNLTLASTGAAANAIAITGPVANVGAFSANGNASLGGNVTSAGAQTYNGALTLTGDSTLSGTTLTFGGSINGAQALTVIGGGSTAVFNGAVGNTTPLASLGVSGPTLLNGGSVTTTGAQNYAGATTLGNDVALVGNGITFGGTLDGTHALAIANAATTTFGTTVGALAPLASLAVDGGGPTVLGGASVDTVGSQRYSGALQVAGNTRLTGAALSVAGIAGAQDLMLQTDTLSSTGPISGTGILSIEPISADRSIGVAGGAGDLQVSQALLTNTTGFTAHRIGRADGSGDIDADVLQLKANTTLQTGSGNLGLTGSVDGAFDLALNTGGVTHIAGPVGTTTALRSLTTDNSAGAPDWDGSGGERTLVDTVDASGRARIVTTGAQTYNDPLVVLVPVQLDGGAIAATQATSRFDGPVHASATQLDLRSGSAITLGNVTLAGGGRIETDGLLDVAGALALNGGTLSLISNATPTSIGFTDPELQGRTLSFGLAQVTEASATLFQSAGGTISSAAGSLLVLRSPNGGSLQFENAGNNLLGGLSAVSGPLGDNSASRFTTSPLGFVRIASTEINAVGAPPTDGSQTLLQAGIEGDVLKLSADKLTTGATGLLRARLPFDNSQGSTTSIPGMTLIMSPTALTIGGGFGLATPDGYIQVRVGSELGGFLTVRPRGASGDNAFILLAGPDPKPFYDGNGKLTEVRVFYNGDAPRTPQESGALTAVTAIVEDARQTRFEEAVRTENVKSRLRSGVIAEVGAGRPATVGRESIRLPQNCTPKPATLQCE